MPGHTLTTPLKSTALNLSLGVTLAESLELGVVFFLRVSLRKCFPFTRLSWLHCSGTGARISKLKDMPNDMMTTLGVIIGNRGFFPDHLCDAGRNVILEALEQADIAPVILPTTATKFGAVETMADARKCAELFRSNREKIDGILVTLPNFGDERGVANAIRWSDLNVPVLVHAFSDDVKNMTIRDRRDSFCGKMSVCNNLRQYGHPPTL